MSTEKSKQETLVESHWTEMDEFWEYKSLIFVVQVTTDFFKNTFNGKIKYWLNNMLTFWLSKNDNPLGTLRDVDKDQSRAIFTFSFS